MREDNRNKNFNSQTLISVKLSFQIIIFVFCIVVFLSLVTGGALFGVAGKAINSFILGSFGHSAYPLFVAAIYFALKLFASKKFNLRKKSVVCAVVIFLGAVLCYHLMTSTRFIGGGYADYLSACFNAGGGGVSNATGGGLLFGIIVFPFIYLFDVIGSYIIFSLVFAIAVLILFGKKIRGGAMYGKVKEYPSDYFNNAQYVNTPVQSAAMQSQPEIKQNVYADSPQYKEEYDVDERQEQKSKKDKVVNVSKKLFVGYIDDYVNPKIKKNKIKSKSYDILYSNKPETDYSQDITVSENNKLGGASYSKSFGDDLESKKKYILTPIDDILRPYEDYGYTDRKKGKPLTEKPPRVNHTDSMIGKEKINPYQKYANDDLPSQKQSGYKPPVSQSGQSTQKSYLDNLTNLMDKYNRAANDKPSFYSTYENKDGKDFTEKYNEPEKITDEKLTESEDKYKADYDSQNITPQESVININKYDAAEKQKRKESLLKYQTKIGMDEQKKPVIKSPYIAPPVTLMNDIIYDPNESAENYEEKVRVLENTLSDFKVPAKVVSVTPGPTVTRYELQMPAGIPVSRLTSRANDIAMCLASNGDIRIEAPIPGKSLLGIELPNKKRQKVGLKDVIDSPEFMSKKSFFTFALGKEITGKNVILDFTKMPHLLVAGSTGSGKSVCLNTLIISLLYKASPDDVRLILIDPKRVEFNIYNGLPHLMLKDVIIDADKAISAFNWVIGEMDRRFELFNQTVSKDIISYNEKMKQSDGQKLPRIFVVVDELAELMMINKRELEDKIKKISQLSRAAGIHLILATQRPSVDIITGVIKANLSSRVTFKLMTQADSRTVLDCSGAEKLLGEGDMIFLSNNMPKPIRLQGPFISMSEVESIVEFVKENNEAYFDDEIEQTIYNPIDETLEEEGENGEEIDKYFYEALKLAIDSGQISISMVQRRFAVGYSRAGKIIDEMEQRKFISPFEGSKPRQVLITREEFERKFGSEL